MKSKYGPLAPCALLVLALATPVAAEIAPVGEELPVATGTIPSRLVTPAVAFSAAGEIMVAWEGFRQGLAGHRLDPAGLPAGPEIPLAANELPPTLPYRGPMTLQREPAVVGLDGGELLAFWIEQLHHVSVDVFYQKSEVLSSTLVAQRLNPRGLPVGPRRVLGGGDLGLAGSPRAARLAGGRVVVVWQASEGGADPGIYCRLMTRRGLPAGPVFRVDSPVGPPGSRPVVAAAEDAGFLVAWHACCDGEGPGVFARRYEATAEPAGGPVRVNLTQAGRQVWPAVARGASGEFLVAWMGPGEIGSPLEFQVYGQILGPDGAVLGPELILSQGGGRLHGAPAVVGTGDGYLATWIHWNRDFPTAVLAMELDRDGAPVGDLVRLSSGPLGIQWRLSLADDGEGGYFAAWEGFNTQGAPSINTRRLAETVQPNRSPEVDVARE